MGRGRRKRKVFGIVCFSIMASSILACQQSRIIKTPLPDKSSRVVLRVGQGPHVGVSEETLDDLEAYRSQPRPDSPTFHLGRRATDEEIAAWDITVSPDGVGLPKGYGNVADGAALYALKCAICHGTRGEGIEPYDALVASESSRITIGSFWPYATTLFDYIRRGMPFESPGLLANNDVYSLTAFLLYKNELISEDTIIDAQSLPAVTMPNLDQFVPDERENYNLPH
jgi:hypothetical protein